MPVYVDPSFYLAETVRRYRESLQRGMRASVAARSIIAKEAGSHSSPEFLQQLEEQVYRSLELTVQRWQKQDLGIQDCLQEVEQRCARDCWPAVFLLASSGSLSTLFSECSAMGYRSGPLPYGPASDEIRFFEPFNLLMMRIPPIRELMEPLTSLEGVQAIYDAEKPVRLSPLPQSDFRAALAECVPTIDPGGIRHQIGLDRCGRGVRVCICDTGIDTTHPDLAGLVEASIDLTDEGDGIDHNGHGTHVAGIVAGRGKASGGRFTGVAPGATLLSARVLNSYGSGSTMSVISGLKWAFDQGAHIVNLSLGHDSPITDGQSLESRVCNALAENGVSVVISAGNSGPDAGTIGVPGDARDAVTVGAFSRSGGVCYFSSRGPTSNPELTGDKPNIIAPGESVVSCRSSASNPEHWRPVPGAESYAAASGTSMAAPMVSGAIAVLLGQALVSGQEVTPADLKRLIGSTSTRLAGIASEAQGSGLLNLSAAFEAARSNATVSEEEDAQTAQAKKDTEGVKDDILNVEELAEYLKLKPVTLYKLLRQGKVPGFKVGGTWRFRRRTIDEWIAEREQSIGPVEEEAPPEKTPAAFSVECGLCGLRLASVPANHCRQEGCAAPICDRCWNVHGRYLCKDHRCLDSAARDARKPANSSAASEICSVCDRLIDDLHKTCEEPDCWNPICLDCWHGKTMGREIHYCPDHDSGFANAEGAGQSNKSHSSYCDLCGGYAGSSGHRCQVSGCWNMICSKCWEGKTPGWIGKPRHYCTEHRQGRWGTPDTKEGGSQASRPPWPPAPSPPVPVPVPVPVPASRYATKPPARDGDLAKRYVSMESAFIERIRSQFAEVKELYHPSTQKAVSIERAWAFLKEQNEVSAITRHPEFKLDREGLAEQFPTNRSLTYTLNVPRGVLAAKSVKLTIEAKFWAPWEALLCENAVVPPRKMTELARLVSEYAAKARKAKQQLVLAVLAPTGWEPDAIHYIVPEGASASRFSSPDISVILLGTGPQECWFDPTDMRAAFCAPLVQGELLRDTISRCQTEIEERFMGSKHVTLEGLASDLPFQRGLILTAMERLADASTDVKLETIPGVGPTLRRL